MNIGGAGESTLLKADCWQRTTAALSLINY